MLDLRRECQCFVSTGSAHVGELLGLGGIHDQVIISAVETDNLTFIHIDIRTNEEATAILQRKQGIRQCFTLNHRNQNTVGASSNIRFCDGAVMIEDVGHNPRTRRQGHEHRTEADQATGGNDKLEPNSTSAIEHQVLHFCTTEAKLFHHAALMCFFAVNHEVLVRLTKLTINLALNNLGARNAELKALSTHALDQYR